MIYSVRHITTFRYEPAVRESVMEVRLQPRSEGRQRCHTFRLNIDPPVHLMQYRDFSGNQVHHFGIAGIHSEITVSAESTVEVQDEDAPQASDAGSWEELDATVAAGDFWELLLPSEFARTSPQLEKLARELDCVRRATPLELLAEINGAIYSVFDYVPNSTRVDSPIEHTLETRKGVCQDFAHIMIALLRNLRVPARYVSGYMFRREEEGAKSDRSLEGASHAWVEAYLPRLGWIAFDPTNNLVGADRHIRVAVGRDYADVPPTRGVHKGDARNELSVAVTVRPSDAPPPQHVAPMLVIESQPAFGRLNLRAEHEQQQQQ